ncbi:DNA repair protein RecO [Sutterella sp.]|uniref:DNA repair protein RecO n=1 Tax=Sutterella sp. TaxID=1981025 RepID=UPI0026E0B36B|nr:DNA repair protein RecO [Sutterella sp.]MDO5531098.1 DNA repair protein RecO [Sutterella sp.]
MSDTEKADSELREGAQAPSAPVLALPAPAVPERLVVKTLPRTGPEKAARPLPKRKTAPKKPETPRILTTGRSEVTLEDAIRQGRAAEAILDEIEREEAGGAKSRRNAAEPALVLHTRPWSESSLVADVLTARSGRLFMIAKGAKRPGSNLRGVLVPFSLLRMTWSGKREAKILMRAERLGGLPTLTGEALLSAFYVNELVLRLTERDDPHPGLFAAVVRAVAHLGDPDPVERQRTLRRFESELLACCGWPVLVTEGKDMPRFVLRATGELTGISEEAAEGLKTWGRAEVEDVIAGRLERAEALRAAREIYREAIELRLDGRPLRTRRVLAELKRI